MSGSSPKGGGDLLATPSARALPTGAAVGTGRKKGLPAWGKKLDPVEPEPLLPRWLHFQDLSCTSSWRRDLGHTALAL